MVKAVLITGAASGIGRLTSELFAHEGRNVAATASLYHASKFALEGFSESLRYEADIHGIRVKLVAIAQDLDCKTSAHLPAAGLR